MMTDRQNSHWQAEEDDQLRAEQEAAELETSVSRLSASPEDEELQKRLHRLEHLLRNAPLVRPSADFAERVILAIRHQSIRPFNRNTATGLALGFSSVIGLILSLLGVIVLLIVALLLNWTGVYQWLILAVGSFGQAARYLFERTLEFVTQSPLMLFVTWASVPLAGLWVWLMRRLKPKEAKR